jgi:hypothetical protein
MQSRFPYTIVFSATNQPHRAINTNLRQCQTLARSLEFLHTFLVLLDNAHALNLAIRCKLFRCLRSSLNVDNASNRYGLKPVEFC